MARRKMQYAVARVVDAPAAYEFLQTCADKADGLRAIRRRILANEEMVEQTDTYVIIAVVAGPFRAEIKMRRSVDLKEQAPV